MYVKDIPHYPDSEGATSHETLHFQLEDHQTASKTKTFLKKCILEVYLCLNALQTARTILAGNRGSHPQGVFNLG